TLFLIMRDNRFAAAATPDVVFFNAGTPQASIFSGLRLTTAWTVAAAYEHYWTPAVRSSIYGVFTSVSFDGTAKLAFCDTVNGAFVSTTFSDPNPLIQPNHGSKLAASTGVITPGCNPDFNIWGIGFRTIWNPVANLDIGLEVFRDQVDPKWDPNL